MVFDGLKIVEKGATGGDTVKKNLNQNCLIVVKETYEKVTGALEAH